MPNRKEQQKQKRRSAEFMAASRVFTLDEFARHLQSPRKLAQYRVRYFLRQKRLKRLRRGEVMRASFVPARTVASHVEHHRCQGKVLTWKRHRE